MTTRLLENVRNVAGTTDTLLMNDGMVVYSNASAIAVTVDSGIAGKRIEMTPSSSGQIQLAAGGGVTLQVDALFLTRSRAQHAVIGVFYKTATTVVVYGDLALA